MSAKHTPGPWLVDAENSGLFEQDRARFWINADGMHIAYVDGPRNAERTANARLIAAAPELLEALLVAHKRITEDRASYVWGAELPDGSMDDEDAAVLHEAYDSKLAQIEAAIAKATAHKEGGAA